MAIEIINILKGGGGGGGVIVFLMECFGDLYQTNIPS